MSLEFKIFPERGFVYVRYEGTIRVDESAAAFMRYQQHPDFAFGQKQLVDLGRVTEVENDFPALLKLQANKAAAFVGHSEAQTLIVYLAPTPPTLSLANLILQSWDAIPNVVARVQTSEEDALALLGLPETRLTDIIAVES